MAKSVHTFHTMFNYLSFLGYLLLHLSVDNFRIICNYENAHSFGSVASLNFIFEDVVKKH